MKLNRLTNSLGVAILNVVFVAVALTLFVFPRFTTAGQLLTLAIVLLWVLDIVLVLWDLWRRGTRVRAVGALLLWLPILFLFGMILQWEGPLYVAAQGSPPRFHLRGLAGFCGLEIYREDKAEWPADDIGLMWAIRNLPERFAFGAEFDYGVVPDGFVQNSAATPFLDPTVNYKLVVDRCMGGPQYFSLHGGTIAEYKPNSDVCWGELKFPERQNPVYVRVDCKTRQPLPMSSRATERMKAYRENRLPFY